MFSCPWYAWYVCGVCVTCVVCLCDTNGDGRLTCAVLSYSIVLRRVRNFTTQRLDCLFEND